MNVIQPLIDLQDVDGKIRELEMEEKDIPRRKAQETARLAGVNSSLEIAKNQLAAMEKRIADERAEAVDLRDKAQQMRIAQATITSNRELQQSYVQVDGLEHDAGAAEARATALETDELVHLRSRVVDVQKRVDEEKGGVDVNVGELDERLAGVKARLAELRAERVEKANAVKALDPGFLLYYERLSTKRWPVVVPLTHDGVCDGCHMKQPPFVDQLVKHNTAAAAKGQKQQRAACTMCGRLLYGDL